MELRSRITTEEQLMSLEPNNRIYIYDPGIHDIRFWNCLARMPYNTSEIMAFYQGGNMIQISKHQLQGLVILTDHNEAYRYMAYRLRDEADAVERIHLGLTKDSTVPSETNT